MAVYPSTDQSTESTFIPVTSTKVDISADGTVRARTQYSATVYDATVIHPLISETEKNTLMTFYDTNKNLTFTIDRAADSDNYTMVFIGEPEVIRYSVAAWTVISKMVGSKT